MKSLTVITGGAGFIGSNLSSSLLDEGHRVICVDNLSSGRIQNIQKLKSNKNFTFYQEDITSDFSAGLVKEIKQADYLYHLASPASPNKKSAISYYSLPIETMLVNSLGTYKLLNFTVNSKLKFLFASTSEIYGDPLEHPQKESYLGNVNSVGVRSCYDEAKRFGESITYSYWRKFKSNVRIIRIFNTYGPKMHKDDGRAIVEFINSALVGDDIPIFGQGLQTRSFCYITDLISGLKKAMHQENTVGEVINLGNPSEISIKELAQMIIKLTSSKSKYLYEVLPQDDPQRRCPDISKAKKLLNWYPKVSLLEGLTKTIEYFQNYPL